MTSTRRASKTINFLLARLHNSPAREGVARRSAPPPPGEEIIITVSGLVHLLAARRQDKNGPQTMRHKIRLRAEWITKGINLFATC